MNVSVLKDLVETHLAGVINVQKMVFVVANLRINWLEMSADLLVVALIQIVPLKHSAWKSLEELAIVHVHQDCEADYQMEAVKTLMNVVMD